MAKRTPKPPSGEPRKPAGGRKSNRQAPPLDLPAAIANQERATHALASAFPFNANKRAEFEPARGASEPGVHRKLPESSVSGPWRNTGPLRAGRR